MFKKGLAVILVIVMMTAILQFSVFGTVASANNGAITIDFNSENGDMEPKTGLLLIPSSQIPDGRLTPLNIPMFRSDIRAPYLAPTDNRQDDSFYLETQLERFENSVKRASDLGIESYPILTTGAPTGNWKTSDTGAWIDPTADYAKWKQLVKDHVQYAVDNNLSVDQWDVWNEYWYIDRVKYNTIYKYAWEAIKEVDPNALVAGPSTNKYGANLYSDVNGIANYCESNGLTMDIGAIHQFWGLSSYQTDVSTVKDIASFYPSVGINQIYTEEYQNQSYSTSAGDITKWFAALEESGVEMTMKSIWDKYDGLDDMLGTKYDYQFTTVADQENPGIRKTTWWAMKAYAEMSGTSIKVNNDYSNTFAALASKDIAAGEAKILVGNEGGTANITLNLNNQPFSGENIRIDKYRVVSSEDNGLVLQSTENPSSTTNLSTTLSMSSNDVWLIVIKKEASAPGSFCLRQPDDGMATSTTPTLTWQQASGATSYTVAVSENRDMSNFVVNQSGISGTSYTLSTALTSGKYYYWTVTANNANGSLDAANSMVYSFYASTNESLPGRFSPIWPANGTDGVATNPEFMWYHSYNETSYTLIIDDTSDFSSPAIIKTGILPPTEPGVVYTPTTALNPDTTYYWKVLAVNANGSRDMNGPVFSFKTKPSGNNPGSFALQSPASGTTNVSRRINLKWDISNGATYYKLEVATDSNFTNIVVDRPNIMATSYTFEPDLLVAGQTYYWRVSASADETNYTTNASNNGFSFTTENVPCSPLLKTLFPTNGGVNVYFSTMSDATSYKIKYGTSPGNYSATISNVTSSPYYVPDLSNGTKYYFAVVAVNSNGESTIFNEKSVIANSVPTNPNSAVSSQTLSSTIRANHDGYIGMKITVGNDPISVTGLGRYYLASNTATRTLGIFDTSGTQLVTADIDMSAGYVDGLGYKYVTLSSPVVLSANTSYYVASLEDNTQRWYEYNSVLTPTSDLSINSAVYESNGTWTTQGSSGNCYGPVNLLYSVPDSYNSSAVSSQTLSSTIRANHDGYIGMKITVGINPISVTDLGRYYLPSNTATRTLGIFDTSGTQLVTADIDMSAGYVDRLGYKYVILSSPVVLSANTSYYVASLEDNTQQWYEYNSVLTPTSDLSINSAVYESNGTWNTYGGSGNCYGPVNILYN